MADYFFQIPDTLFNLEPINARHPGIMADKKIKRITSKFQILDTIFNIGHKSRTQLENMAD